MALIGKLTWCHIRFPQRKLSLVTENWSWIIALLKIFSQNLELIFFEGGYKDCLVLSNNGEGVERVLFCEIIFGINKQYLHIDLWIILILYEYLFVFVNIN